MERANSSFMKGDLANTQRLDATINLNNNSFLNSSVRRGAYTLFSRTDFADKNEIAHESVSGPSPAMGSEARQQLRKRGLKRFINIKRVKSNLAGVSAMAASREMLRGFMSALSLASIVAGLIGILVEEVEDAMHLLNAFICTAGIVCVLRLYAIKSAAASLSNTLYEGRDGILHSPYLTQMFVELFLWTFTPPYLDRLFPNADLNWVNSLDYFSFLRMFNIALYLKEVAMGKHMFMRILSVLGQKPISTGYFFRTSMVYEKVKTSAVCVGISWVALGLAFHQAEGRSLFDSFNFVFVTAATIGYGDISPKTHTGKIISFVAWVFGLLVVGWVVSLFQASLNLTDSERNMYLMYRASKRSRDLREEAAKTIQIGWRFYRIKRLTTLVNGQPAHVGSPIVTALRMPAVNDDGTSNIHLEEILGKSAIRNPPAVVYHRHQDGGESGVVPPSLAPSASVVTSSANRKERFVLTYTAWRLQKQCNSFKRLRLAYREDVAIIDQSMTEHEQRHYPTHNPYHSPTNADLVGHYGSLAANIIGSSGGHNNHHPQLMGSHGGDGIPRFNVQIPFVSSPMDGPHIGNGAALTNHQQSEQQMVRKRTLSELSLPGTPRSTPLATGKEAPPKSGSGKDDALLHSNSSGDKIPNNNSSLDRMPTLSLEGGELDSQGRRRASSTKRHGLQSLADHHGVSMEDVLHLATQTAAVSAAAITAQAAGITSPNAGGLGAQNESIANRKLQQEMKKFTTILTQVAEQQSVLLMSIQELKADVNRVKDDQERMRRNPMRHLLLGEGVGQTLSGNSSFSRRSPRNVGGPSTPNSNGGLVSGSLLLRPTPGTLENGSFYGPPPPTHGLASTAMGHEDLPPVLRGTYGHSM